MMGNVVYHSTEQELRFLRTIGCFRKTKLTHKQLLQKYWDSSKSRDWGNVNVEDVKAYLITQGVSV